VLGREKKALKPGKPDRPGRIIMAGREVDYTLVRVRSRKKMSILVNPQGGVEVRVPFRVTISQAEAFLKQCHEWVFERLKIVEKQLSQRPALVAGAVIPFLDEKLVLEFNAQSRQGVERVDGRLILPKRWSHQEESLQGRLELWFKRQARSHFRHRLNHWAQEMGVEYNRLAIRSQKTIWGSCSAKNNINLNWRLMWMPFRVADYVVIHELSHLNHMDHSRAFWIHVHQFEPDYLALRRKLQGVETPW
jgi:predicted metal-dependent hydrolase